jgi:hypothetical protein
VSIASCIRVCTFAAASLLLVACGAAGKSAPSSTGRAVLSARQVKAAFGREGIVLRVAVDSRTLDQKRIAQLTRLRVGDVGVIRAAKLANRAALERLLKRSVAHPVIWLAGAGNAATTIDVLVCGRVADAQSTLFSANRFSPAGVTFPITRVANVVVVVYDDTHAAWASSVKRAVARLPRA